MNIQTKIHDKFSIEFKMGFANRETTAPAPFTVNVWIFTPNSLDINANTFDKNRFYQNVKSNVRLITPTFTLQQLAQKDCLPMQNLAESIGNTTSKDGNEHYEFQVKMFAAIFKNALRHEVDDIQQISDDTEKEERLRELNEQLRKVISQYRNTQSLIQQENSAFLDIFHYGDEYLSHIVEVQVSRIILQNQKPFSDNVQNLSELLIQERRYKSECNYSHLSTENSEGNIRLISRHGLLKKYIESALYLKVNKAPDNVVMQQISLSTAAGIALIVSTLISFPFQKYLSNYPILIFAILIFAYMCKDIVKELMRKRFTKQLKGKYYDNKSSLKFKGEDIGWIKEVFNHVSDEKIPAEVLAARNRSGLERDNTILEERAILYRKQVHINAAPLQDRFSYRYAGIYDIIRIHIQDFTHKMDDPIVTLRTVNEESKEVIINTLRSYTFHIVLEYKQEEKSEYRTYRIRATRDGILDCEEISTI